MTERSMTRAGSPATGGSMTGGLGANQIRWLRSNMKPFDDAWKAVQASDAHARKIRSQLQHASAPEDGPAGFDEGSGPLQRLRLVERRARRRGPVSA